MSTRDASVASRQRSSGRPLGNCGLTSILSTKHTFPSFPSRYWGQLRRLSGPTVAPPLSRATGGGSSSFLFLLRSMPCFLTHTICFTWRSSGDTVTSQKKIAMKIIPFMFSKCQDALVCPACCESRGYLEEKNVRNGCCWVRRISPIHVPCKRASQLDGAEAAHK